MTAVSSLATLRSPAVLEPITDGSVLSVPGLRGVGIRAGLKQSGDRDLTLLVADEPRVAAAVFTRSELKAAPVILSRELLDQQPLARSLVINAGNANALTGPDGEVHAAQMSERVAERCGGPALVLSTGIIGEPLPIDLVLAGIDAASSQLTTDRGDTVARAMMTTDTHPKTLAVTVDLADEDADEPQLVTVGGVAKGSGMIHPNMATMLAVVATDAPLTARALQPLLTGAVDRTFNGISIDGDTSTNDAVVALAGGADLPTIDLGDDRLEAVRAAVEYVCGELAGQIARDGEGVNRVMRIRVNGARSTDDAQKVADTIACSPLVKTALAGGDPNWGRILAAAGRAGVTLDVDKLSLSLAGHAVFRRGRPVAVDDEQVGRDFGADEVTATLDLGLGDAEARMLTTDLTAGYIKINADYHT